MISSLWDKKSILIVLRYIAQLGRPAFKADGSIELNLNNIKGRTGRRFCRSIKLLFSIIISATIFLTSHITYVKLITVVL